MTKAVLTLEAQTMDVDRASRQYSQNKKETVLRKVCSIRKLSRYSLLREKVRKLPYVSRLLPLHQWIKSKSCCLFADEETGASKRMEI